MLDLSPVVLNDRGRSYMVGFHSIKGIWTLVNLDVERFGERFWAVTITVKQRAL